MSEVTPGPLPVEAQRGKENRKLGLLAGKDFKVSQVGDAGYIVHNLKRPPNADGDWILIDIDDTIAATSSAKAESNKNLNLRFFLMILL